MRIVATKNLDIDREQAYARIDREVGEVRALFITISPGQELVYQQKYAEAVKVRDNLLLDDDDVPHLAAEAAFRKMKLSDLALLIIDKDRRWRTASSQIEVLRLDGKRSVAQAVSPAAIHEAAEIDWKPITALAK